MGREGRRAFASIFLLEVAGYRGEGGGQPGAHILDRGNNHDRDQGRDQPIFDRGGSGFVADEPLKQLLHLADFRELQHANCATTLNLGLRY